VAPHVPVLLVVDRASRSSDVTGAASWSTAAATPPPGPGTARTTAPPGPTPPTSTSTTWSHSPRPELRSLGLVHSQRQTYANDLGGPELWAVIDNVNQSKGDQAGAARSAVASATPSGALDAVGQHPDDRAAGVGGSTSTSLRWPVSPPGVLCGVDSWLCRWRGCYCRSRDHSLVHLTPRPLPGIRRHAISCP
jgi:hypothetical protein